MYFWWRILVTIFLALLTSKICRRLLYYGINLHCGWRRSKDREFKPDKKHWFFNFESHPHLSPTCMWIRHWWQFVFDKVLMQDSSPTLFTNVTVFFTAPATLSDFLYRLIFLFFKEGAELIWFSSLASLEEHLGWSQMPWIRLFLKFKVMRPARFEYP